MTDINDICKRWDWLIAVDWPPCTEFYQQSADIRFLLAEVERLTGENAALEYMHGERVNEADLLRAELAAPDPITELVTGGYTVTIAVAGDFLYHATAKRGGATIKSRHSDPAQCLRQLAAEVKGYEKAQKERE